MKIFCASDPLQAEGQGQDWGQAIAKRAGRNTQQLSIRMIVSV
jgi:hypothetical protein